MARARFQVTRTMIEDYCEKGFTVKEMSEDITRLSGEKCAPAFITDAAKKLGIDLRKKNRSSAFELVDDAANTATTETTNETSNEEVREESISEVVA